MSNLWDRPPDSAIPLRSIDKNPEPIFAALGRAVSNWEGVQAAVTEVYFSILDHQEEELDQKALDEFGRILRVPNRAKALRDRTDDFFKQGTEIEEGFEAMFRSALSSLLKAYEGWTQRRNDLAHGYVTEWEAPDYSDDNQPIVTFFGLLPSHARTRKWFMYEPEYNYIAQEIEALADAFLQLDNELAELARKMNEVRVSESTD